MIDKNKINQLNEQRKSPKTEAKKPSQGFEVRKQTGNTRTSLVIDKASLALLDENAFRIRQALGTRSINLSVLARIAIAEFNKLSYEKQLEMVQTTID